MKICSKCKQQKENKEFGIKADSKDGLQAYCRICKKVLRKVYYQTVEKEEDKVLERRTRQTSNKYKENVRNYRKSLHGYIKVKATQSKRRKYLKNSKDRTVNHKALEILKEVQESKCYYCKSLLLFDVNTHLDHYVPLSKGGAHTITNVVWSCAHCNLKKNNKVPKEQICKNHVSLLKQYLTETESLN